MTTSIELMAKPCVMVIDDNRTNLDIMEALLLKLDCEVRCCASGQEALTELGFSPAALIFMDFHMPDMDGPTLTREIRHREGLNRRTPIIGLTAMDADASRQPCKEAGMDDVLTKPIFGNKLKSVLAQWVLPKGGA